jgi:phytoene dehydrogenase-like protein
MPLDRCDAVVIGAGVEGLSAALTLALAGKKTVCVDRRSQVEDLGGWDEAWVTPAALRALGLFQRGVHLTAPTPNLSLVDGAWRVLWPDTARTARTLAAVEGDAFIEFANGLIRCRTVLREPGAAARAMLSSIDIVRQNGAALTDLAAILRESALNFLDRRHRDEQTKALLLAMAARFAPAAPQAAGSAPMLLTLAPFFDGGEQAPRPIAGGGRAMAAALAAAFTAAGGELTLGHEVSEIQMEREAAMGVALGPHASIKTGTVIAAIAPKRLTQGLLSTRRYGRLLSGLRAPPRQALAAMRLSLAREPDFPDARLGLWRSGVSVWLGASTGNLQAAFAAMQARRLHDAPVVELRFDAGLREATLVSPYCPGELADGPWTDVRRDALRSAFLASVRTHWPQTHALIEDAAMLSPGPIEASAATGAIFGGADRGQGLDTLFAWPADTPGPLLKGVYLCAPRALDPDGQAGIMAAGLAAGLGGQRLRA